MTRRTALSTVAALVASGVATPTTLIGQAAKPALTIDLRQWSVFIVKGPGASEPCYVDPADVFAALREE